MWISNEPNRHEGIQGCLGSWADWGLGLTGILGCSSTITYSGPNRHLNKCESHFFLPWLTVAMLLLPICIFLLHCWVTWDQFSFLKMGEASQFPACFCCCKTKVALSQKIRDNFFHCQNKYSKTLSWADNQKFLAKTLKNSFKFSAKDSDLEYLFWRSKNSPIYSDLKPPLVC